MALLASILADAREAICRAYEMKEGAESLPAVFLGELSPKNEVSELLDHW